MSDSVFTNLLRPLTTPEAWREKLGAGSAVSPAFTGDVSLVNTDPAPTNHYYIIDGPAGTIRAFLVRTSGSIRWIFGASGDAESGGNAGTNLFAIRYNDAGVGLDYPFLISRATGEVFINNVTLNLSKLKTLPFTPVATPATGAFVNVSASGHYAVIGDLVLFTIDVLMVDAGTGTGVIVCTLPFAGAYFGACAGLEMQSVGFTVAGVVNAGTAQVSIFKYDGGSPIASGRRFQLSGCYRKS